MKAFFFAVALMLGVTACGAFPKAFKGRVVNVSDGDTITVLASDIQIRVRLQGIDAPESKQAFGTRSKQFLSSLAMGKEVSVSPRSTGIDRYGRVLGEVTLTSGKSLNLESVLAGMSWWYQKYAPNDKKLKNAESQARKAKRGLWSDPKAIAPWEFRKPKSPRPTAIGSLLHSFSAGYGHGLTRGLLKSSWEIHRTEWDCVECLWGEDAVQL